MHSRVFGRREVQGYLDQSGVLNGGNLVGGFALYLYNVRNAIRYTFLCNLPTTPSSSPSRSSFQHIRNFSYNVHNGEDNVTCYIHRDDIGVVPKDDRGGPRMIAAVCLEAYIHAPSHTFIFWWFCLLPV